MNSDFTVQELRADVPDDVPAVLKPKINCQLIKFRSRAPAYLIHAFYTGMLTLMPVKHLEMIMDSFACTDKSAMNLYISILVGNVPCSADAVVGTEYLCKVTSGDSILYVLTAALKPMIDSGARDGMFNKSIPVGILAPRSELEFRAQVTQSVDAGIKAVSTNFAFWTDAEERLFEEKIDEPNALFNARHSLPDEPYNVHITSTGLYPPHVIIGTVRARIVEILKLFHTHVVEDKMLPGPKDRDGNPSWLWTCPTDRETVPYLLQNFLLEDKFYWFCRLNNDYHSQIFTFTFMCQTGVDGLVAHTQKKIDELVAMVEQFNMSQ